MNDEFEVIIEELTFLLEDGVPKNVQRQIEEIISYMKDEEMDNSTKINKALTILEDISNDNNLDPISRTQFLSVSSSLEALIA